jgi:hypothetical protein
MLRTQSQREIEQSYREMHFREKLAIQPSTESSINSNQLALEKEKYDLARISQPKDEEYLVDDFEVVDYILNGRTPNEWKYLTAQERELKKSNMTRTAAKFQNMGGRLSRVKKPKKKPNQLPGLARYCQILSAAQKEAVLKQLHDFNGHPNQRQTLSLITERYWWRGITKEIKKYVKECPECQFANQPTTERSDGRTLTPTEVDRPFDMVGLDLAGPFPETKSGYQYLIIAVDYYTGYSEVGLAKSTSSQYVCEFIHKEIICRHGTPAVIVMDNDAAKGDVKLKCAGWGIMVRTIQPYAAYMNGFAEAMVKNYKKGMRKLVRQLGLQWDQFIWDLVLVQRIVPKTPTGISPFELLYGRRPILRVERLLTNKHSFDVVRFERNNEQNALITSPTEATLEELWLHRRLESLLRITHQKMLQDAASVQRDISQMRAITNFAKRQHRGVYRTQNLKIDQMVIMRKHKKDHNLDPGWEGPYVFRGFYDDGAQVALIEDFDGTVWPRHITQIHPYWPRAREGE